MFIFTFHFSIANPIAETKICHRFYSEFSLNPSIQSLQEYISSVGEITSSAQFKSEVLINAQHKGVWGAGKMGDTEYETSIDNLKTVSKLISKKDNQRFVDIGSGLGIPILHLGSMFPQSTFYGYEIIHSKVLTSQTMANRMGLKNVKFFEQDLSEVFEIPSAVEVSLPREIDGLITERLCRYRFTKLLLQFQLYATIKLA